MLTGGVRRRLLLGRVTVWLDGQEVARGWIAMGVDFGPLDLMPGSHSLRVSVKLGSVGQDRDFTFSTDKPGAWRLDIDYDRMSGTISYDLAPPGAPA